MSDFLQICHIPIKDNGRLPLMLEFPTDERLLPILVSSTRSVLWVHKMNGSVIRAAIREYENLGVFYCEILNAIVDKGIKHQWENSFEFSSSRLKLAIEYINYYGIEEVEILTRDPEQLSSFDLPDIPVVSSDWIPPEAAVVIPQNKEFLGFVGLVSEGKLVSVVHNAVRGVGIAWNHKSG